MENPMCPVRLKRRPGSVIGEICQSRLTTEIISESNSIIGYRCNLGHVFTINDILLLGKRWTKFLLRNNKV